MERHARDQQMVGMFEHENYLEEGFEDNWSLLTGIQALLAVTPVNWLEMVG